MSAWHHLVALTLLVVLGLSVVWFSLEAFLLWHANPLTVPLAHWGIWPVACSSRGCLTSKQWRQALNSQTLFAAAAGQAAPLPQAALTTLIRQHLAAHALPTSPVTSEDMNRYRQEVLHLVNESTVKQLTGLTMNDYEQQVLRPFLEQEALRQLRRVETPDELYQQLAKDRPVFVLPRGLYWDTEKAAVVKK